MIPGWKDPLEKGMATHSNILAWRIPWTEEPGQLQSMGSQESDNTERLTLSLFTFTTWTGEGTRGWRKSDSREISCLELGF